MALIGMEAMIMRFDPWRAGALLLALGIAEAIAGCDKARAPAAAPPTTGSPAPTAAKTPVTLPPSGQGIAPLCLKFSDDVAKAVGQPVISVKDRVAANVPLLCLYRTAALPAMIEVGPGGDLAAERKGLEKDGHPSDSPIGNGAFRTGSNGFNQVIGQKGGHRVVVGGTAHFPPLEALWLKVAQGL